MKRFSVFIPLIGVLLLCFLTEGCGAAKKIEQDAGPTPEQIVSDHILLRDPIPLIDDLERYPEFKDQIENALYRRISYDTYDYRKLKEISRFAQDDFGASVFFDSLLVDRQESILSKLAEENDLVKLGAFYRDNSEQYGFLRNAFKEAYFGDLDTLGYYGLRSLHKAFENTDLDNLVKPRYSEVRTSLIKGIMTELHPYFTSEKELLDSIDEDLREELEAYIENGVVSVMSEFSEKLDRGFFKRTFKRKAIDNYSITEYAEKLVSEYIDKNYIAEVINAKVLNYIQASTNTRYEYLTNYCEDAADNDSFYIAGDVSSLKIGVDNAQAQKIQNLKLFNKVTSLASFALMFTPIGWPAAIVDLIDLFNGVTEESKIQGMMNRMSEDLYTNFTNQVDTYLSDLHNYIDKAREDSKNNIMKYFYEVF